MCVVLCVCVFVLCVCVSGAMGHALVLRKGIHSDSSLRWDIVLLEPVVSAAEGFTVNLSFPEAPEQLPWQLPFRLGTKPLWRS